MKNKPPTFHWENVLVPWAVLCGAVLSFAVCCYAGRSTTKENQYPRFKRFHQVLSPEAQFYPTASQIKRVALARTRKDRINVIIGGSSILNGAFQRPNEVWTDYLAKVLGDDYRVVNLGIRGAGPGEVGALAAEMVLSQRERLIYVCDMFPLGCGDGPDGYSHRYFFWDAWEKKLVDRTLPHRAESVARIMKTRQGDEKFAELLLGAKWDSKAYFTDLWTTLNYRSFGTIWNPVTKSDSFKARAVLPDNDPGPATLEQRNYVVDHGVSIDDFKRMWFKPYYTQDSAGNWRADSAFLTTFRSNVLTAFPNASIRKRTVLTVQRLNAHRINKLTEADQSKWSAHIEDTRKIAEGWGMRSVEIGKGFSAEDYTDYTHLSASGGVKMADILAPIIKEMSEQLGYRQQGPATE